MGRCMLLWLPDGAVGPSGNAAIRMYCHFANSYCDNGLHAPCTCFYYAMHDVAHLTKCLDQPC